MKIVITSVGSLVGQNILDTLQDRRTGIELIGVNSTASAAGNFRCDRCYLAPPAASATAYRQRLEFILGEERPDLVLPGRDDDVVALAALKEAAPALGQAIPLGPLSLAQILDDKWASHQFAKSRSLPFVDSALTDDDAGVKQIVARHGYPLIAKPRRGNGSRGVRVILDDAQCATASQLDDTVIQPYLQPEPELMSTLRGDGIGMPLFYAPVLQQIVSQAVIGTNGEVRGVFCTVIELVMGRAERLLPLNDADVARTARRYAEAVARAGWVGALNLQGRRDRSGSFLVYELNGRLSGGTKARTLLGFDELGLLIESFLGRTIPAPTKAAGKHGIVTKSLVDFATDRRAIEQLQNEGRWQKDADHRPRRQGRHG